MRVVTGSRSSLDGLICLHPYGFTGQGLARVCAMGMQFERTQVSVWRPEADTGQHPYLLSTSLLRALPLDDPRAC